MAVVVRCPGCRGAAQVGPEAVGLLVVCPRCNDPFLAVEEAAPVAAPAKPSANGASRPLRPRRDRAEPVSPPDSTRPRRRRRDRPETQRPAPTRDPHDPPPEPAGGVPASVLFGLALLPFAIPLLWLIGPLLLTQPPALSAAAPTALAVAAAALCMAVVYTVDWTPATRIKGVLMLVGLSYFAGLSLYFLKKDMVDRVKDFFSPADAWHELRPAGGGYQVRMPGKLSQQVQNGDPMPGWTLTCFRSARAELAGPVAVYTVGSGPDAKANGPADPDEWFAAAEQAVRKAAGPAAEILTREGVKSVDDHPGRQWQVRLPNDDRLRVVRVFRVSGKVYYLAVEGEHVDPNDDAVESFFNSFHLTRAKN